MTLSEEDSSSKQEVNMSTISNSTTTENYMQNLAKSNRDGYAYNDEYGFAHVVKDYETAIKYSGDGKIYSFEGKFGGGYALDNSGNRASLDLPDTKPYGNDIENNHTPKASKGKVELLKQIAQMDNHSITAQLKTSDPSDEESKDPVAASFEHFKTHDYLAQIQLDLMSEKLDHAY